MLLDQALHREAAVEQYENDERMARRREIQELQTHYQNQKSDK